MAKARGAGLRGGKRTPIGIRIDAYTSQKCWKQRHLATALGLPPHTFNDMLAGRKALTVETLNAIVGVLNNCTLADLTGDNVSPNWCGVEKRFFDSFSHAVGRPWYFFEHSEWSKELPEDCLSKTIDCFEALLEEVSGFTISWDAVGIRPLLGKCIVFLERGHLKHIRNAGPLLFDACDRLVHCLSFTFLPAQLKLAAQPYVDKMRCLLEEPHVRGFRGRLWAREGDVLKICSEHDGSALIRADDLLQRALGWDNGRERGFETIRNRVLIGSKISKTNREFADLVRTAEQSLDSWCTVDGQRHVLESVGEACAYRFSKTGVDEYRKMALDYYARGTALGVPAVPTEMILRLKRLPVSYARHGIPDLISSDGAELEELKRLARSTGSARVAQQADKLEAELKRMKIIKM